MISFSNITKRFGTNLALSGVSFGAQAGSVHAVTGENGAGKSTLMNLLGGFFAPDEGEIRLRGELVAWDRAGRRRTPGVSSIHQELSLLPNLTVAENLFLGREPVRAGLIDRSALGTQAAQVLARLGNALDVDAYCGDLSVADQQMVEIAKGISVDAEVFIFDEPTAALNAPEVERLGDLLASLRSAGKLVFYVSHRLEEIFRFCDTVTVLKDGRHVVTRPTDGLTREDLVSLMVGRVLSQFFPPRSTGPATPDVALEVRSLRPADGAPDVSFALRRGEILGLAGLEGQGQRGIIRSLAGLVPFATGDVRKGEGTAPISLNIVDTVRSGIGFVPEDRKTEGLYLPLSITDNITLGILRKASIWRFARTPHERIAELTDRMSIRSTGTGQQVGELSGGNQQKVMIGRWLASGIDILLLEEPTRGVDVGAKAEIYALLRDFADAGGAVLMVSSELLELLGLSDRILVVRGRRVVAELRGTGTSEEEVMHHALTGGQEAVDAHV
jgi:ribose transport system ATP-binding protein